ncbi:MAG: sugar transferase [Acidimicrobiales bacterium]
MEYRDDGALGQAELDLREGLAQAKVAVPSGNRVAPRRAGGYSLATNEVIDLDGTTTVPPSLGQGAAGIAGGSALLRLARAARLSASKLTTAVDALALLVPVFFLQHYYDLLTAVVTLALAASSDLYRPRLKVSLLDELPPVIGRLLAATGLVATVGTLWSHAPPRQFLTYAAIAAASLSAGRALTTFLVRLARHRGIVAHPTVIVGSGDVTDSLVRSLASSREYGLQPIGWLADEDVAHHRSQLRAPRLGNVSELPGVVRSTGASVVIVSLGGFVESRLLDLIREGSSLGCQLFVVPRFPGSQFAQPDHIGAVCLTRLSIQRHTGIRRALKRAFDIALAAIALLVLLPVIATCALAVRIECGGSVLYKQLRLGANGQPFTLLKFRSMIPLTSNEGDTTWSIAGDPRVGPVGRVLRRFALDELPQLWNILRGDMTFVGPRPERPFFVRLFTDTVPDYKHRLRVPPGLTGLAQVNGLRGDTSIEDRARHDNYYIEEWSLWLDFKVLLRTVGEVLRGTGR